MKKLLLLFVVGGGWWYFHGGRLITVDTVNGFYQDQMVATLKRDPEALCEQLAPDYRSMSVLITREGRLRQQADRAEACGSVREMYADFARIGYAMGGIVQLDYDHHILKVTISDDRKSAVVETAFSLDVAGSIMNIKGSSIDTLIRRNGKIMVLHSESKTRITSG